MWWVIALQAAGPPDIRPRRILPPSPAIACPPGNTDEVVVCARDPETFRLRATPPTTTAREGLPPAQATVAGVVVSAESEAGQALGAAPPRAMVSLKLPF